MMKKLIIAIVMSVVMILGLAACGSGSSSEDEGASEEMVTVAVSIDFPKDSGQQDIEKESIEVAEGTSLIDVMTNFPELFKVETVSHSGGVGVGSINEVAEDGSAGWLYTVNEEVIMDYPDAYQVKDGDAIQWTYSEM